MVHRQNLAKSRPRNPSVNVDQVLGPLVVVAPEAVHGRLLPMEIAERARKAGVDVHHQPTGGIFPSPLALPAPDLVLGHYHDHPHQLGALDPGREQIATHSTVGRHYPDRALDRDRFLDRGRDHVQDSILGQDPFLGPYRVLDHDQDQRRRTLPR